MRFFRFGKKRSSMAPEPPTPAAPAGDVGPTAPAAQEIVVYGTADGSRCRQVRALLEQYGYAYRDVRVDDDLGTRSWLQRTTGDDALPKVFIGARCYGGFEDLQVLAFDGRLERLVHGESPQDGGDDEMAALKQEMSTASLVTLLRRGEALIVREGDMETEMWAEALGNPPSVYYEGAAYPMAELERLAERVLTRLRNGEIEVSWKGET
jgi:glutaredoxin